MTTDSRWAESAAARLIEAGYGARVLTGYPEGSKSPPERPLLWLDTKEVRLTPLGMGQDTKAPQVLRA